MNKSISDTPQTLREFSTFARDALPSQQWDWIDSGSEFGNTVDANRRALENTAVQARIFRDVSNIDAGINLFGADLPLPLMVAPVGHLTQFHQDGEAEIAAGGSDANSLVCVSPHTRLALSEIREMAPDAALMYQVVFSGDRKWIEAEVRAAEKIGARAIGVVGDAPMRPVRYLDREARYDARNAGRKSSIPAPNPALNRETTWNDIAWLTKITDLPVIIKGVMHPEDARLAIESGASGIWVSNHGGRQLDSGLATAEVVPEIRAAVGNKTIIVDGGVRTGTDILKLLALGADVAAIGRPAIYALAVGGRAGVKLMFDYYLEEFIAAMAMSGISSIDQIGGDLIRRRDPHWS